MRRLLLALTLLMGVGSHAQAERFIVLASTTSVDNSGLLQHILPTFTAETGIAVHVVAQGTGQALATAAHGDADVVLVHDPVAEDAFMAAHHGISRRKIAWNDFVFAGPESDPAHIRGDKDAPDALRRIATEKAAFVSRGDMSGTDALEKRLWKAVGIVPNAAGNSWYREIGGGMGAALNMAASLDAYLLTDRGTWLSFGNKRHLRILLEGDTRLLNRYDVITLTPSEHKAARVADSQTLADWLAGPKGQAEIAAYKLAGEVLFHPAADPEP